MRLGRVLVLILLASVLQAASPHNCRAGALSGVHGGRVTSNKQSYLTSFYRRGAYQRGPTPGPGNLEITFIIYLIKAYAARAVVRHQFAQTA